MFQFLYFVFVIPGTPFAALLSRFKKMGNGNEGTMIEFAFWSVIFGIVVWVFVVAGGIWAYNNLSISLSIK